MNKEDSKVKLATIKLIDAIYANLQQGTFKADAEPNPTIGMFIVGLHIREELTDLEDLISEGLTESYAVNDEVILSMVVNDLQNHYDYTEEKAVQSAPKIAQNVIEAMWDTYGDTLAKEAINE